MDGRAEASDVPSSQELGPLNLIARVIWLIIKELQGQEDQKEHGIDRVMHE